MKKALFIIFFAQLLAQAACAQDLRKRTGPLFSNEEMADFLLYKSRKQMTKGLLSLVGGPALIAAGTAILVKNQPVSKTGSDAGFLTCSAGLVTTLGSLAFFNAALRNRQKAKLLLRNEGTSFYRMGRLQSIPSFGLQVSL